MTHPLRFPTAAGARTGRGAETLADADLAAAREAIARCDWQIAAERLAASLARGRTAEACEAAGLVGVARGDLAGLLAAREEAFRLYVERDERRAAARMALALGFDYASRRGEVAVGGGWLQRARRLLSGIEPCEEHAWLAFWEGHIAYFLQADIPTARARVAEGFALCREAGWPGVEAFGLALEGRILVAEGRLDEGMRRLDEAAAATVAGELSDADAAGQCCCCVLHACEEVGDCDRALQWYARITDYSARRGDASGLAYCRGHLARILVLRGSWPEAEEQLERMIEEIGRFAPAGVAEGFVRLGDLRRRQGRLDEATALFAAAPAHPEATLGEAAVALARGDAADSADLVERFFRRLPAGDSLGRAPGLALLIRACIALGRRAEGEAAAVELEATTSAIGTHLLLAEARAARALLAGGAGDVEAARRAWEDAVDLYARAGAPWEEAHARLGLAGTLRSLGRPERAERETATARAALDRLGVLATPPTPADEDRRVADAPEPPTDGTGDDALAQLSPRQIEVLRLVAQGLSNREIGERLFVSEYTVKRHVADILARLDLPSRSAAAAWAAVRQCCS